ncbi:MAG: modified peptide precursor CbpA [Nitrospinae bacterium]|nr:modified peptide precursor CbpA [Nitrospinota bacterium]
MKNTPQTKKKDAMKKDVIASRKSCNPDGTGLSHYVLMDKRSDSRRSSGN